MFRQDLKLEISVRSVRNWKRCLQIDINGAGIVWCF